MEEMASEKVNIERNVEKINESPIKVNFDIEILREKDKGKFLDISVINPTFKVSNMGPIKTMLIINGNNVLHEIALGNLVHNELVIFLDGLSGSDPKTLQEAYSLAGLYFKDKQHIIFGNITDSERNIYIKLTIVVDGYNYLCDMCMNFTNPSKERISSVKRLYNVYTNSGHIKSYLNGMLIGPGANYPQEDEMVVRNICCRYCGSIICASTYHDYFCVTGNTTNVCDKCKNIHTSNTDVEETRTYTVSGTPEQLDTLEALFNEVNVLSGMGSSRGIKLYVDGDGAVNLHVKSEKDNLNTKAAGYGMLKRNSDGYLQSLDLG